MNVLKKIQDEQVMSMELSIDKTSLELTEGCDNYFDVNLSKEEVIEFINELNKLYKEMK